MSIKLLYSVFRRHNIYARRCCRYARHHYKNFSEGKNSNEIKDQPIKYSTSEAAKWKAIYSTSGKSYFSTPPIQSPVVVFSLTAFMVYFCILREENDLDVWLRELENTVPVQIEEAQLRLEIENDKKKGVDVNWKESRLKELVKRRENLRSN